MNTLLERENDAFRVRNARLAMAPSEFREVGHRLVDELAERLARVPSGPVAPTDSPQALRQLLGGDVPMPPQGTDAASLVREATDLLFDHAVFNGHPRFFGYITSSPAPIGMLGDFLASALNQNVGAWNLAPLATEIEAQTVRWIAELVGLPATSGGLLVSGGNMANLVGFIAARAAKASCDLRKEGVARAGRQLLVYASTETHTWIHKAVDLTGLGTDAIRWIATDDQQRLAPSALQRAIEDDVKAGHQPFLVVGNAGTVSTGSVDPLDEIAAICRERNLWFHVDGAYGALAARIPGAPASLSALRQADSVAVDPHKWLYAPLEVGCVLVRDPEALRKAFSYTPAYYHFDSDVMNYFEYGPQNSRGFRALKVWLALRQVGLAGYLEMIGDDIALAGYLHELLAAHGAFQAVSQNLSVTTFRYVPADLASRVGDQAVETYLDELNRRLLTAVEKSGEAFLSNAVVSRMFVLRACIVNFHTSRADVEALPRLVSRLGREVDEALRRERGF